MQRRKRKIALLWGVLGTAIFCFFIGVNYNPVITRTPNFAADTSDQRQVLFVSLMVPKIDLANQQIMVLRKRILQIVAVWQKTGKISKVNLQFLQATATAYRVNDFNVKNLASVNDLLMRVDIVPASLVLAQAATESGWGSSHFAQRADNFFGQHCYSTGCGFSVQGGVGFEVEKFNGAQDAVNTYFYNINTNDSYRAFRVARAQMRASGQPLIGEKLVPYLVSYSILGQNYVNMINSIISAHGFAQYDKQYN